MERQPCVYILASGRCRDLYTGDTSDLMARLHQHRTGITREKRIKKWNRDWKLNLIEQSNPAWVDLAIGLGFEPLASSATIDPRLRGDDGIAM